MKRLLLVFFTLLFAVMNMWAATWYVGPGGTNASGFGTSPATPFLTIQYAINQANATDVIQVAAGTYNEQITINKALTLNGDDGAVLDGSIWTSTWTTGVKIKSGNVTFNNIDVQNYRQDGIICGYEASIPGNLQNIHITNCKVANIQPGNWGFGIYVGYESEAWGYTPPKLTSHLDYSGLLIENNEITNTHSSALVLQSITASTGALQVKNNNIHDNTTNDGIWIDCARNITIENNIINGNLWGIELSDLNESTGALNGPHSPKDITIYGNIITNSIQVGFDIWNGWPSTITITGNIISNNVPNAHNYVASPYNANLNWWGSNDPATVDGGISTYVDYTPYLNSGTDSSTDPGFQPDLSNLWVDDNSPQMGTSGRIQEGIDLVSGSTVNVAAGAYTEPAQILINKNLTLLGESKSTTFLYPGSNTTNNGNDPSSAFIYIDPTSTVVMKNFTIDGAGKLISSAIQSRGALDIEDCDINNVQYATYYGRGIVYLSGTTGNLVKNVTMSNIERIGVHVRGSVVSPNPVVAIDHMTYTGKGAGSWLDYAVEFGAGGQGTIDYLTASNCGVSGSGWGSSAVLASDYYGPGTQVTVTNSTFTDNEAGIAIGYLPTDASVVIAHHNKFYGAGLGIQQDGGLLVNAENNYWGSTNAADVFAKFSGKVDADPWCDETFTVCNFEFLCTNTTTGVGYPNLGAAIAAASPGDHIDINNPGNSPGITVNKNLHVHNNSGGIFTINGASPALTVTGGTVTYTGVNFTTNTDDPTILVSGGKLILRNCTIEESTGFVQTGISVTGTGELDAGLDGDAGHNTFILTGSGAMALASSSSGPVTAIRNFWGSILESTVMSRISGVVYANYSPWCNSTFTMCGDDGGPYTYDPKLIRVVGTTIVVPIKVTRFNDINAVSLRVKFNTDSLTFVSGEMGPTVPSGSNYFVCPAGSNKVNITYVTDNGFNLSDNDVLVNLTFTYNLTGKTKLTWEDDATSVDLEYQKASTQQPYYDFTTAVYYIPGYITNGTITFDRQYSPDQTLEAIVTGGTGVYVSYEWTGPGGFTATGNPIILPPGGSGDYHVVVTDSDGASIEGTYHFDRVHNLTTHMDYHDIQAAINAATTGDVLVADAGDYVEHIVLTKQLELRGAKYGADACGTGRGTGETVLYPNFSDPQPGNYTNSSTCILYVPYAGSGSKIDGFTFNGDSPAFDVSSLVINSHKIDAAQGINAFEGIANLTISNNIFQYIADFGIGLSNYSYLPVQAATYGNVIRYNKFEWISPELSGQGWGFGIHIGTNAYTDIRNNCMDQVQLGIEVEGCYKGIAGNTNILRDNTIASSLYGIYFSGTNFYPNTPTPYSISYNNLTQSSGATGNTGMAIRHIQNSQVVRDTGNVISNSPVGIDLFDNPTSSTISINGGTIQGCGTGILAKNYEGSNGASSSYVVDGTAITNCTSNGVYVKDDPLNSNGATISIQVTNNTAVTGATPIAFLAEGGSASLSFTGSAPQATITGASMYIALHSNGTDAPAADLDARQVMLDGLYGSGMSLVQLFATEDKIDHKIDFQPAGFVLVKTDNAFVTDIASASATNNDYTRIRNAMDYVGNDWTINLHGTFDWTEVYAAASWALGNDGVAANVDDYCIYVRPNLNGITFTAPEGLSFASINGPGDLPNVNLEGVLVFDGGDNQGWTISQIQFFDFDLAIGMFNGAGGSDAYNNTNITSNFIQVPVDLNITAAPADANQNIGIHYSFGTNQQITDNIIFIQGNGVSDGTNYSSSVGMQSNTSGGNVYNGLLIDNNTIQVGGAQSANPAAILGIWENGWAHNSNITVSNNWFLSPDDTDPATNLERAFRVTSHSSATTTVTYSGNKAEDANIGFQWISGGNFSSNLPITMSNNLITGNYTGVLMQSGGKANFVGNRIISNNLGIDVTNNATLSAANNFMTGNTTDGLKIAVDAGTMGSVNSNDLSGNTSWAIENLSGSTFDATCNWYGTNTVAGVAAEVSGPMTYDPWLIIGTDSDSDPSNGFQPVPGTCTGTANLYVNDLVSDPGVNDVYTTDIGNDLNTGTAAAPFRTIQKAVNIAVTGTSIWVDAGNFPEQVQIGKTVNVTGVDSSKTIVLAPVTMSFAAPWNSAHPVIYAYGNANSVNISKLCINGDGGRNDSWFIGMLYYDANGTFTRNRITGIRHTTFTGATGTGHAFYATQAGSMIQTLAVDKNRIDDYQKGGIYIRTAGTSATVSRNTVIGQDIPEVLAQNGIVFLYGPSGTVENNTVTNNIWNHPQHPHDWEASGILLYQSGAVYVNSNTLTGDEMGIASESSTGETYGINTFSNNKIHVWLDAPADVNPGNVYDKYVLNPAQGNLVFGCIQYAEDESTPGDIINASAGTFTENVVVHAPVTINGAGMASTTVVPALSAPNPGGGGSLPAGASNIFLVQSDDVTIQNLTADGNNTLIASGVMSNGVDVDARNGIIVDYNFGAGIFNNLDVNNVKVQNIYLRGIYASSGGTFDFNANMVTNVAGDPAGSIAMMNWGGIGSFTGNIVSNSIDGIVSNWSTGTIYTGNNVSNCGSGIHTDNNSATADMISGNTVSDCDYGIFVFSPFVAVQVLENNVSNCAVGLGAYRSNSSPAPQVGILRNTVNVPATAIGAEFSTDGFGWGDADCKVLFTNNYLYGVGAGNSFSLYTSAGYNLDVTANDNFVTNFTGGVATALSGTQTLDFNCNWWGSSTFAGVAAAVVATNPPVDYAPWLTGSGDGAGTGFQPTASCDGVASIAGNMKYYHPTAPQAMTGVQLALKDGPTTVATSPVDGSGNYLFADEKIINGTYSIEVASNPKAAGSVNSTDAAQVNYWGVHNSTIPHVRYLAGDVTGALDANPAVNSTDATNIQLHFVHGGVGYFDKPDWAYMLASSYVTGNTDPNRLVTTMSVTVSNASITGYNLYGMSLGDFNSSYLWTAMKGAMSNVELVYEGSLQAGSNAEVDLPLNLVNASTLSATSLILQFPSDLAEITGVTMKENGGQLDWSAEGGNELRIGWNSPLALPFGDGEPLVTLHLRTTGAFVQGQQIRIELVNDPLNELADESLNTVPDALLSIGTIESTTYGIINPEPGTRNPELTSYPNPFSGYTMLKYSLPVNGHVTIVLSDMLGRQLEKVADATLQAGTYQYKLDSTPLQPGIYTVTLTFETDGGNMIKTIKLVRQR